MKIKVVFLVLMVGISGLVSAGGGAKKGSPEEISLERAYKMLGEITRRFHPRDKIREKQTAQEIKQEIQVLQGLQQQYQQLEMKVKYQFESAAIWVIQAEIRNLIEHLTYEALQKAEANKG